MKGNGDVLIFLEEEEESTKVTENKVDVIFMLDYNHLSRIGNYSNVVRDSDAFKVMIDHHQEPESKYGRRCYFRHFFLFYCSVIV